MPRRPLTIVDAFEAWAKTNAGVAVAPELDAARQAFAKGSPCLEQAQTDGWGNFAHFVAQSLAWRTLVPHGEALAHLVNRTEIRAAKLVLAKKADIVVDNGVATWKVPAGGRFRAYSVTLTQDDILALRTVVRAEYGDVTLAPDQHLLNPMNNWTARRVTYYARLYRGKNDDTRRASLPGHGGLSA